MDKSISAEANSYPLLILFGSMTKILLFVSSTKYSYMERRVFPGEGRTFGWHGKGKTEACVLILGHNS